MTANITILFAAASRAQSNKTEFVWINQSIFNITPPGEKLEF